MYLMKKKIEKYIIFGLFYALDSLGSFDMHIKNDEKKWSPQKNCFCHTGPGGGGAPNFAGPQLIGFLLSFLL